MQDDFLAFSRSKFKTRLPTDRLYTSGHFWMAPEADGRCRVGFSSAVLPDHPLSGNTMGAYGWEWSRKIKVRPFASLQNRSVRYVTVQIYKRSADGRESLTASLSSVVNSISSGFPTTQL